MVDNHTFSHPTISWKADLGLRGVIWIAMGIRSNLAEYALMSDPWMVMLPSIIPLPCADRPMKAEKS